MPVKAPRIEIHDRFFDKPLLDGLKRLIADCYWRYGWKSTKDEPDAVQFHCDFTRTTSANRDDATGRIEPYAATALLPAWGVVQDKAIRAKQKLLRSYANLNISGTEGLPHRDTEGHKDDLTCILYCCEAWPIKWGGETAIYNDDEEIVISVVPRENRLLLLPSHMLHAARTVSRICPEQRITLMWKSAPADASPAKP